MTTRKKKANISNVNDLRNNLSDVFEALRNGDIAHKEAKEISNLAGKMINSAKVQLDYHGLRKDEDFKIDFLHSEDK
jgi:hypothetical protein|tara:strand:- start:470 stop:700 length:231 start_codon:yes stop_codon:yes gene_type:complete